MGILSRYIVLEILKVLFPVWFGLAFLMFLLEYLSKAFNVNAGAWVTLSLYLLKVPSYLQLVFPAAALFAVLAVLGTMNRQREIVALQSSGVSSTRVLGLSFLAVFLASIPYMWLSESLSAQATRAHLELYDSKVLERESRFSEHRREKIWYKNRYVLYNVRYFDFEKNTLFDVTIYTFDEDFHIAQTIYAQRAVWKEGSWELQDGSIAVSDKRLEVPVTQGFERRTTSLIEEPQMLVRTEADPEAMTQKELRALIDRYAALGINTASLEVTYHSRYSFFLVSFVFLLLAFPRAMRFSRSGGVAKDALFVVSVSLFYWLIFNIFMNLGGAAKLNPTAAAWAPSVLFFIVGVFYFRSRTLSSEST